MSQKRQLKDDSLTTVHTGVGDEDIESPVVTKRVRRSSTFGSAATTTTVIQTPKTATKQQQHTTPLNEVSVSPK